MLIDEQERKKKPLMELHSVTSITIWAENTMKTSLPPDLQYEGRMLSAEPVLLVLDVSNSRDFTDGCTVRRLTVINDHHSHICVLDKLM